MRNREHYNKHAKIQILTILFPLFLVFIGSACNMNREPIETLDEVPQHDQGAEWHEIDPVFRATYKYMGGQEVFGKAISRMLMEGNLKTQYVEAGKLVFDQDAPKEQRFRLAPLGREMGVAEPAVPEPSNPEIRYIDGHTIFPDFLTLYEQIGGERVVGKPLSEMHYNQSRRRYEQYFENLGFYRMSGHSEVHLLAYGVMICDYDCRAVDSGNAKIDTYRYIDPTFEEFVDQMGLNFTGFALTEAYFNRRGWWEQIFANMVLEAENPSIEPESVTLRPLSKDLGIVADPPRQYIGDPNMYFYAIEGEHGYEVPVHFWAYIKDHGGLELFGPPITHYSASDRGYRQCFVNICLLYDPNANGGNDVRPVSHGYDYVERYYKYISPVDDAVSSNQQITTVRVWELYPALDSNQQQEIGVIVLKDFQPVVGLRPELILILPDGSQHSFPLPPTRTSGKTHLRLPPIEGPNGTVIEYQVCISHTDENKFCAGETFVIWNNP